IVSEPKTITATIIEKIGTSKKNTIAKVNIPLPDDNEATAHSPVRIPFESTDAAVNGFVIARASWSTEARTRRRESVAQPPPLTYSEVVREEPLPGLFGALGSLCGPADLSRKLKPMRRAPIRQQNFSPSSLNLVVNVQSAVNLPTRNDGQLQPVVEVAFQNARRFTPSVSGRNPNWQQGLSLPVQGANDPKSIIDCIKLSIYDQVR
ncbi:unnamed protein product, partial [Heligmosomoides polygyrus]|uniref:C2 domain-containing protein n=1 Tax=Heligmosomoides polygyrus TaxID=6339 RepID=A0A183G2A1_HELPZ